MQLVQLAELEADHDLGLDVALAALGPADWLDSICCNWRSSTSASDSESPDWV